MFVNSNIENHREYRNSPAILKALWKLLKANRVKWKGDDDVMPKKEQQRQIQNSNLKWH